jgi:hypothetical protein
MRQSSWNSTPPAARVDEDQRQLVLADRLVDHRPWRGRWCGPASGRRSCGRGSDSGFAPPVTVTSRPISPDGLRHQKALQVVRLGTVADRPMRCSSGAKLRSRASPSDSRSPRLEVTSECSSSSTTAQVGEERLGVAMRDQQRQLLGRRQQDVGRPARSGAARAWRPGVAGAGLDLDRQPHLGDRAFRDCGRCRRRAPSAARCRACAAESRP